MDDLLEGCERLPKGEWAMALSSSSCDDLSRALWLLYHCLLWEGRMPPQIPIPVISTGPPYKDSKRPTFAVFWGCLRFG